MDPLEGEEIKGFKIGDKTVDVEHLRHPHSRVVHGLPGHEEAGHGGLLRTDKRPKGPDGRDEDLVQEAIDLKKKQKEILEGGKNKH
ncbi:hypothetical protein KL905_000190 [Ogataea polymorpha]|uniref:Uncharacterized protein n=1 Tax=Ogataea polymorpha TaxID=460523 RepID=A0A9P8P0H7_9ASCO|nr:hypothetical protein KL937_000886 [Ogataea polymorpha]KAG7891600.1 hypothetical protein KL936_001543 [Ogataea polymorpha]KAG7894953.1 hypothetical protein KL908_001303 [Ogataea polymorpha]KAG7911448.1 hypothetical protein KL906_000769 [Ogataea polymorpha]KAG7912719.1 hypothetical protein KL907_000921 [Ogataea polymorpha]